MNNGMKKGLLVGFIVISMTVLAFMVGENPLRLFECTFKAIR